MVEEKNSHGNEEVKTFKDVKERFTNSVARNKTRIMVVLIIAGVLMVGGTIKLINYSSSPGFCVLFCHEMIPEYRTWKQSVHAEKDVTCEDCHYEPGIMGVVKAKWRAKGQLISHVFGGYLDNDMDKAEKENIFLEVQNIHQQGDNRFFIKADKHGLKIVNDNCRRCHSNITEKEVVSATRGVRVAHNVHIKEKNLECTDCHIAIVHGEEVLKRNLPKMRICFRCHKENSTTAKLGKTNCKNCHIAQEMMWAGKGGTGVKTVTSAMYGSVACPDCHKESEGFKKPKDSSVCLDCHEKEVVENYYVWKDKLKVARLKLQERITSVEEKIALAKKGKTSPEQKEAIEKAENIFNEANSNLQAVNQDGSNGIHNNEYALGLLDVARDKLQKSLNLLP